MSIATLSIDLEARLARLEEGMDRAARINQKAASDIASGWRSTGIVVKAALAPLAAALTVNALSEFVKRNAEAVESLNDIKAATGSTVENISALQDIATKAGKGIEVAEDSLIKFNQALNSAKAGSEQADIFRRLNLDVAELKKLDPAEALRRTAVALEGVADDGNKARAVLTLTGKSVKEVAPFLKDLAEAGKLNASVTQEQADRAERFVRAVGQYETASTRARQALVGQFLPAITDVINAFNKEVNFKSGILAALDAIGNKAFDWENSQLRKQLKTMDKEIADLEAKTKSLSKGKQSSAFAVQASESAAARLEDLRAARDEIAARLRENTGSKDIGPEPPGAPKRSIGSVSAFEESRLKATLNTEQVAKLQAEAEEQAARDSAEAWDIWGKHQIDIHNKERQSRIDALNAELAAEEMFQQDSREAWDFWAQFVAKQNEDVFSDFRKKARENLQSGVAESLFAGLEGRFQDIDDLWRNLLRKMVAEALAAQLNEALFGTKPGGGAVNQFLKFLGFAGNFAEGGFIPPGQWGWTGEEGPEPVFGGRTGVTVQSASGRAVQMGDINIHVDGTADQAKTTQQMFGIVRQAQVEQMRQLKAMGVLGGDA